MDSRGRLIARLREAVIGGGGVWIRLAAVSVSRIVRPSASGPTSMRPVPEDYHRFAAARRSLDGCCTHFVSTHAYTHHQSVLADLRQHDTQSHGHFHHVYREPEPNRAQPGASAPDPLRARDSSRSAFAGAARPLAAAAWTTSSRTWAISIRPTFNSATTIFRSIPGKATGSRGCLQIPVHPVCEGLFLEAGVERPGSHRRLFPAGDRLAAGCRRAGCDLRPSRATAGPDARGHDRPCRVRSKAGRWYGGRRFPSWRGGGAGAASAGGWSSRVRMSAWRSSSTTGIPNTPFALEIQPRAISSARFP